VAKVAEFDVPGKGTGSVHISETGKVRLELPGRYGVTSIFPGTNIRGALMDITLVPTK
jgi:hypothetical protein